MLSRLATQLQNRWMDLNAYPDMRPDYRMRQQVKRSHADRPLYSVVEWHQRFWYPLGVQRLLSEFVYELLGECSGLEVGRLLPSDRLMQDLQLPLVCWFDWEMVWTEQFGTRFELETDWILDIGEFETLEELMVALDRLLKR
jgi:hypothetical protein